MQIPTFYRVEKNAFYVADFPLESVPMEQKEGLRQSILAAIERGNPTISRERAAALNDSKNDPLLRAMGVRSWSILDEQTEGLWILTDKIGPYEIRVSKRMKPRGVARRRGEESRISARDLS